MNKSNDFENELYTEDKKAYTVTIWTLIFSALFALCIFFCTSSMHSSDAEDMVAPSIMRLLATLASFVTVFPLNIISAIREFCRKPSVNAGKIICVLSFILCLSALGVCLFF